MLYCRTALVLISLVLVAGCGREETVVTDDVATRDTADSPAIPEPSPIAEPTDLMIDETEEPSLLESALLARVGRKVRGEGEEHFRIGDRLELTVRFVEVPEKLAAWVHWLGPEGEMISEEQISVPENGVAVFDVETKDWEAGDYRVEIYIGGDLADIKTFQLSSPGADTES